MANNTILGLLQQHLTPETISSMSQQLGASPAATSSAISAAIPALLGGLHQNASSTEGAQALDAALGAHDGSILDNLGSLLGGSGGGIGGGIGGAILGHILGSRRGPVEDGVAKSSGLNTQQVGQLLMMLAPIIMGVLGKMKKEQGVGPSQLPEVIGQSTSQIATNAGLGGLGGLLDSNHDGQIGDDVMRIGSSVLGGLFGK